MKRNHAVVWLPPRSVGERALATEAVLWTQRFDARDRPAKAERLSLDSLAGIKGVTLIFDARDVSLIRSALPALPTGKLQKALPNIIEEKLLQDANACAFGLGPVGIDGERLIAVIDKAWLEFALGAFERRGVSVTAAWPAQLVVPIDAGGWGLYCVNDGVCLRHGAEQGLGWTAGPDLPSRAQAISTVLQLASAGQPVPDPLPAYCDDPVWAEALRQAGANLGIDIRMAGLAIARQCTINLLDARPSTAGQRWLANVDWRAWRLPAWLAAGAAAAFLIGLNLHWAQLSSQRNQLKLAMEQKFKQSFPNTPVVVDPVLQMQRQVAALRTRAGQSGPDDFGPLLTRLPAAIGGKSDLLAGLEYREGRLRVRFAPTAVESRVARDSLVESFRRQGLSLKFDGEGQAGASVGLLS